MKMANLPTKRKQCMLLECCPWHEETLIHWVYLMNELGYFVDIYSMKESLEANALHLSPLKNFRLHKLAGNVLAHADNYDFVILNTLLNEGHIFLAEGVPVPILPLLQKLPVPSLSVIHDPQLWMSQELAHIYEGKRGEEELTLYLFANHQYMERSDTWCEGNWKMTEHQLFIYGTRSYLLESTDGGQTFSSLYPPKIMLRRRSIYSLHAHLQDSMHHVCTLTPNGMAQLRNHFDLPANSMSWMLPIYVGEIKASAPPRDLIVLGEINFRRKNFESLLQASEQIRLLQDDKVYIAGGSRGFTRSEAEVNRLREAISQEGLQERIVITGYLPYTDYYQRIACSRFIIPLVDETIDGGSYLMKISAAITQSIAFNVPMIINETIARLHGLDFMICYPGDNLSSGIEQIHTLTQEQYQHMKALLRLKKQEIEQTNRAHLRRFLTRMTPVNQD